IRVAEAYFNVLAAEDSLASEIAARESIARQLEQAQRRNEVGLDPITVVQEAQAGYDQAVAAVIAAERVLATAQEFLREIIDDYVVDLKSPVEELPLIRPNPENVEQWVEIAEAQNLSLVSTRINADIAQDDVKISRSVRFPTLSLSASAQDSESTNVQTTNLFTGGSIVTDPTSSERLGNSVSLSFSIPIYSGGVNRSRIQQSVYRHRAAVETLERVARQTERQTRDAYLGVISEISRVEALRQSVASSQTALRATEAGMEVGQRTIVDVLQSQNNLRRAQTNYARSRYDYMLNILRLKQAAGSLTEEDLAELDSWLE
ncbi:MAG: TolC family outer membrane protein, partial [Gammaproteobacteria bacterium]|nr:TolC family outer membrane protein [Gammaproteobacteria bacterium]